MSTKPAKTKIAVLKLASEQLAKFPHIVEPSAKSSSKATSSSSDTPVAQIIEPTPTADTPAESAATPAEANTNGLSTPSSNLAPPPAGGKRKGVPGPKPGAKRGAAHLTPDGLPKPRGKPGPKKKQKL